MGERKEGRLAVNPAEEQLLRSSGLPERLGSRGTFCLRKPKIAPSALTYQNNNPANNNALSMYRFQLKYMNCRYSPMKQAGKILLAPFLR